MSQPVPCGKCPECLKRRVSGWSFRLMQEERRSSSAYFITLTYDTQHVPISRNGFMTLDKRDVQLFMKRLRKAVSLKDDSITIKYYLCGEYGKDRSRPHYHAIVFNVPDVYDIERAWRLGQVNYGTVTGASVGYTLKYMDKPKRIPMHRNDDRIREFGVMSKGLGCSYITDASIRYHSEKLLDRVCLTIEHGKKIAMPRYYKDKIYTEQQRLRIAHFGAFQAENQKALERARYTGDNYERDVVQQHLEAFRQLHFNSEKRQTL